MSLDIVCYYADYGRPYLPLMQRMAASALKAMPKARLVLLTPTPGTYCVERCSEFFDTIVPLDIPTPPEVLCRERARAMASWMMASEIPTLFVDPDVEFLKPVGWGQFDVGLLWRTNKPDQPVNTGLILARPGVKEFWHHYGTVAVNLPRAVHYWWCDQLAFALLTGICHQAGETLLVDGARVRLLDANEHCALPEEATPSAWAHHYKGRTKGPEWDKVFLKSGDGKSSPASASSTDTGGAQNLA
jgi:hypothetical protein